MLKNWLCSPCHSPEANMGKVSELQQWPHVQYRAAEPLCLHWQKKICAPSSPVLLCNTNIQKLIINHIKVVKYCTYFPQLCIICTMLNWSHFLLQSAVPFSDLSSLSIFFFVAIWSFLVKGASAFFKESEMLVAFINRNTSIVLWYFCTSVTCWTFIYQTISIWKHIVWQPWCRPFFCLCEIWSYFTNVF